MKRLLNLIFSGTNLSGVDNSRIDHYQVAMDKLNARIIKYPGDFRKNRFRRKEVRHGRAA